VKEFEQGVTDMKKVSSRMFHHSMRESWLKVYLLINSEIAETHQSKCATGAWHQQTTKWKTQMQSLPLLWWWMQWTVWRDFPVTWSLHRWWVTPQH
jgi:hypothetical protein